MGGEKSPAGHHAVVGVNYLGEKENDVWLLNVRQKKKGEESSISIPGVFIYL